MQSYKSRRGEAAVSYHTSVFTPLLIVYVLLLLMFGTATALQSQSHVPVGAVTTVNPHQLVSTGFTNVEIVPVASLREVMERVFIKKLLRNADELAILPDGSLTKRTLRRYRGLRIDERLLQFWTEYKGYNVACGPEQCARCHNCSSRQLPDVCLTAAPPAWLTREQLTPAITFIRGATPAVNCRAGSNSIYARPIIAEKIWPAIRFGKAWTAPAVFAS